MVFAFGNETRSSELVMFLSVSYPLLQRQKGVRSLSSLRTEKQQANKPFSPRKRSTSVNIKMTHEVAVEGGTEQNSAYWDQYPPNKEANYQISPYVRFSKCFPSSILDAFQVIFNSQINFIRNWLNKLIIFRIIIHFYFRLLIIYHRFKNYSQGVK